MESLHLFNIYRGTLSRICDLSVTIEKKKRYIQEVQSNEIDAPFFNAKRWLIKSFRNISKWFPKLVGPFGPNNPWFTFIVFVGSCA